MQHKIKILLVEDAPLDAELVVRELKKGKINSEILVVDNRAKFENALNDFSFDIILSDHSLPFFDSHEALRMVKQAGITVPFILITSTMTDEFAVNAMKEGVHDYIIKDRLQRLPSAVIQSIERHRLEMEQKATHERLVFHIDNTPLGFIEWDGQGFIKSFSTRAEEIFGWSEKELMDSQKAAFIQVHEEDLPLSIEIEGDLVTGVVERNTMQQRNITRDGRVIWCEWFNSVLKDKEGKVITIMSLVQDITEKKKAEESNIFKAHLLNIIGQSVIATDMKGVISFWNKAAEEIYGWSAEEAIGKKVVDIIPAQETREQALEIMTELSRGRSWTGEMMVQRKDGKFFPAFVTDTPIYDQRQVLSGIIGVSSDITERKRNEENLASNQSRLKQAQVIAHVGNWEVDMVHNLYSWSDEMYKIFETTREEVIPSAESFLSFTHPEDFDYAKEKLAEAMKTLQNSSLEFRFIRRDGVTRYGYSEWKFEFGKNQEPIRLFGIIQDLTERKLAEIERIKMVNDLTQRNKDLEQFTYIVSHNLRAPVANILGATNLLTGTGLNTEKKDVLGREINDSVARLDNVIKDLNHILQVKREISEVKEKVRFSELVEDIKISIKNLIDKYDIKIKYDFSEIDEFSTLKSYLYSIFYNLISNSIKYRRQEIPCIIEIESQLVNNKIALIFTDNGMGIDLQKKGEQVFGLYKRFHTNVEGKGMGLFMVKTQVETLGGKISIQSEVNRGTEFNIEFEI